MKVDVWYMFKIFYILCFQDKEEGKENILMNAHVKNEKLLFITFVVS